jgi:DNA-3-methyladenine glycosylase II
MHIIRCEQDIEEGLIWLLQADPRLVAIADKAGPVPLRLQKPGYAGLADIIVSQMVSKASAAAIWSRLMAATGNKVSAEAVLLLTDTDCRQTGLSVAKTATLRRVARAVADNQLNLDSICDMPARQALRLLTSIKGVGPWTAEVYLMFSAGHPDIFPVGDVALRNALAHAFPSDHRLSQAEAAKQAEQWSPWRSVAARLFWAYSRTILSRPALPGADLP